MVSIVFSTDLVSLPSPPSASLLFGVCGKMAAAVMKNWGTDGGSLGKQANVLGREKGCVSESALRLAH